MNKVTRIVIISLCAALALSSCSKKHHTPDQDSQKTPLSFTASSNGATVKADSDQDWLSNYHNDFGVWGIARHYDASISPYLLWDADLERVRQTDQYYQPENPAFWVLGYTYNFLALAPFTDLDAEVRPERATATTKDKLVFEYDLGKKYDKSDYAFDLMGAAATSTVDVNHDRGAQEITFWHLFAQICINVEFVGAIGSVDEMRLYNVDSKADYTISFDNNDALSVNSQVSDDASQEKITFSGLADGGNILHIVPQNIRDITLFLDFTIEQTPQTSNFEINLSNAHNAPNYGYNQKYNWNIKISPKEISFDVVLSPWESGEADQDFTLNYPEQ